MLAFYVVATLWCSIGMTHFLESFGFFLSNVRKVFTFCRQSCENAYSTIADVSRSYADKLLVLCYNLAFLKKKHRLNHFKQHLFVKVLGIYDQNRGLSSCSLMIPSEQHRSCSLYISVLFVKLITYQKGSVTITTLFTEDTFIYTHDFHVYYDYTQIKHINILEKMF